MWKLVHVGLLSLVGILVFSAGWALGQHAAPTGDLSVDQKLLAYQYLQVLPQIAQGNGNTIWMLPSELTDALGQIKEIVRPSDAKQ